MREAAIQYILKRRKFEIRNIENNINNIFENKMISKESSQFVSYY